MDTNLYTNRRFIILLICIWISNSEKVGYFLIYVPTYYISKNNKKLFNAFGGGGGKPGETNLVLLFDILLHFLVPHKLYVPVIWMKIPFLIWYCPHNHSFFTSTFVELETSMCKFCTVINNRSVWVSSSHFAERCLVFLCFLVCVLITHWYACIWSLFPSF